MVELVLTVLVLLVLATPLTLSVVALLDAARRPRFVWALADRAQVAWMAAIMFGVVLVPLGLAVSIWYLTRVRSELKAIENGDLGVAGA